MDCSAAISNLGDVSLAMVENLLRTDPSVHDCTVLRQTTNSCSLALVCYVVPRGRFVVERLMLKAEAFPEILRPQFYVPVGRLPLTLEGSIDKSSLRAIGVIDRDLQENLSKAVSDISGVREAIALQIEPQFDSHFLHLGDLLPNGKNEQSIVEEADLSNPIHNPLESSVKQLSALTGAPLLYLSNDVFTLGDILQRAANQSPEQGIIYISAQGDELRQSYVALLDNASRIANGLNKSGVRPGSYAILQIGDLNNYFEALWGCILGGIIPIPLAPSRTSDSNDLTCKRLQTAIDLFERPPIIFDQPSSIFSSIPGTGDCLTLSLHRLRLENKSKPSLRANPSDTALVLLTSGTTGFPKAVIQTHENLVNFCAGSTQLNQLGKDDLSLNWMPVEHIGALADFHLRSMFVGASQIHASTEHILANPIQWLKLVHRYRARVTWAPNFAFSMVNDCVEDIVAEELDLSCLSFLINAGEAISAHTARRFLQLLSPCKLSPTAMRPTWGMSETCSGALYGRLDFHAAREDDSVVDVGRPLPGLSVRIVDNEYRILPVGRQGELQVRGGTVTPGYARNPAANQDAFTADGWFRTGDLARVYDGRVAITGRAKDLIILNGVNFQPRDFEEAIEELYGITRGSTAACSVRRSSDATDSLAIFFQTQIRDESELKAVLEEIRGTISRRFGVTPKYLLSCEAAMISRTETGKIQRIALRRRFERGEFDLSAKRSDILLGNSNTVPAWFYEVLWRSRNRRESAPSTGPVLIFADKSGLATEIISLLQQIGRSSFLVGVGERFCKIGEAHFLIDPKKPTDYQAILDAFLAQHGSIECILHLWTCDPITACSYQEKITKAHTIGCESLLIIFRMLMQSRLRENCPRLYTFSVGAQAVGTTSEDYLGAAAIPTLLKTLASETTLMRFRHIDFSPTWALEGISMHAKIALEEMEQNEEFEVAYRSGVRLCPRLRRIDFEKKLHGNPLVFKPKGLYLLTGGLGGVGRCLAKHLLEKYGARLVIIGRTQFPKDSDEEAHSKLSPDAQERLKSLKALQRLSGLIEYWSVDVCDTAKLSHIIDGACKRFKTELDGVIHLAGTYRPTPLCNEPVEGFSEDIRAKVLGTCVLADLLRSKPQALFIGFSSASAFFGGASLGAYASANRFIEWFVHLKRCQGEYQYACVGWSIWDEIGISKKYLDRDMLQQRGLRAINEARGIASMAVAMQRGLQHVLIGLDASRQNVRRYLEDGDKLALQRLTVFYTGRLDEARIDALHINDRFGTRVKFDLVQLSELPHIETGEIDIQELLADSGAIVSREKVQLPRSDLERRMAVKWAILFGIDQLSLGVHANFFSLGGHSIIAAELLTIIENEFGANLPADALINTPTIAGLCAAISAATTSIAKAGLDSRS